MCGIIINSPKRKAGQPWLYDRDAFRVFPRNRLEDHYVPSEQATAILVAGETTLPVATPPPSLGNGDVSVLPAAKEEEQPSEAAYSSPPPPENPDQPSSQTDVPTSASPDTEPKALTLVKGRPAKKAQKQGVSHVRKQHRDQADNSKAGKEEARRAKLPVAKKASFDLANSAVEKKVRFARDLVARSTDSSSRHSGSSSSSSSFDGSDDSFIDTPLSNVSVGTKSNGPRAPKFSISKLPPDLVAESSSRYRRHDTNLGSATQVASWNLSSPGPLTVQKPTPPIRPGTPFSYAANNEQDLDSELGSLTDRGSAPSPMWENPREFSTSQNTKWNAKSLGRAPLPTTSSDLSSDLGSNVDSSKK